MRKVSAHSQAIERATNLQRLGRLAEAEQIYRAVLQADAHDFNALHLLGVLRSQQGRHNEAIGLICKALERNRAYAPAHYNLGCALRAVERNDEAVASFRRALKLKPNFADAHSILADTLNALGRYPEAIESCRRAIALSPDDAGAHYNHGIALHEVKRYEAALESYERVIALNAYHAAAYNDRGMALRTLKRPEAALESYERAIDLKPDFAEAYNNRGNALRDLNRYEAALESYERAIGLRPQYAEAYYNRAILLQLSGSLVQARCSYRAALKLKADAGWEIQSTLLLPIIPSSVGEIRQCREEYALGIDRLLQQPPLVENPDSIFLTSHFYLAFHGCNDRELLVRQAELCRNVCPFLSYEAPHCRKARRSRRERYRIGFASKFLRDHTIGRLLKGVIANLSRQRFEVVIFFYSPPEDGISRYIWRAADKAVVIPEDIGRARKMIADAELDILFYPDIGMEPRSYQLAFARLAPVQCTTWGHPDTSGIPNVDYFVSHENCEIQGSESHYSEKLLTLSSRVGYTCYERPVLPEAFKTRAEFNLDKDKTLYLCPQSLFKLHPEFDIVLAEILRKDRDGILVLIEGSFRNWTALIRRRLEVVCADVLERIQWVPRQDMYGYLSLLRAADVVLDTFHFGGGNSSFEAFAVGAPVVTLPAKYARGRFTYADYKRMQLMDCVADSVGAYIGIAVKLGTNRAYREGIRTKILACNQVLYDDKSMVTEFELLMENALAERSS